MTSAVTTSRCSAGFQHHQRLECGSEKKIGVLVSSLGSPTPEGSSRNGAHNLVRPYTEKGWSRGDVCGAASGNEYRCKATSLIVDFIYAPPVVYLAPSDGDGEGVCGRVPEQSVADPVHRYRNFDVGRETFPLA
jgi:hypothetical protein